MWTYDNINLNPVPSGTIALYTEIAGKFKKMGYPGVAVIASVRDSISYLDEHPEALEGTGVVRFTAYTVHAYLVRKQIRWKNTLIAFTA